MMRRAHQLVVKVPSSDAGSSDTSGGKARRSPSTRLARQLSSSPYAPMTPATQLGNTLSRLSIPLTRTRSGASTPSPRASGSVDDQPHAEDFSHAPSKRGGSQVSAPKPAKKANQSGALGKRPARATAAAVPAAAGSNALGKRAERAERAERAAAAPARATSFLSLAVPKEQQEDTWDCGLACARMVLLAKGCAPEECSLRQLRTRLASSEVWSIDLAYLLREYGLSGCEYLTTSTALPSPSRRRCPFYAATLGEDTLRVAQLIGAASAEGVTVSERTLSATELWNTMHNNDTLAIALVDPRLLHLAEPPSPTAATSSSSRSSLSSASHGGSSAEAARSFYGHYVLIVGLDDRSDSYIVKDPASGDSETRVPAAVLEAARTAHGTDEDLLLIPLYDDDEPCAPLTPPAKSKIRAVLAAAAQVESPVLG